MGDCGAIFVRRRSYKELQAAAGGDPRQKAEAAGENRTKARRPYATGGSFAGYEKHATMVRAKSALKSGANVQRREPAPTTRAKTLSVITSEIRTDNAREFSAGSFQGDFTDRGEWFHNGVGTWDASYAATAAGEQRAGLALTSRAPTPPGSAGEFFFCPCAVQPTVDPVL